MYRSAKQKKRPLFGATLFKEANSGGNQRRLKFGAAPRDGNGQSGMSRTSRVKLFQRCGLFSAMEISICRTKMGTGGRGRVPFWEPVQNQDFRVNHLEAAGGGITEQCDARCIKLHFGRNGGQMFRTDVAGRSCGQRFRAEVPRRRSPLSRKSKTPSKGGLGQSGRGS